MVNIQLQEDVVTALTQRAEQVGLSLQDFLATIANVTKGNGSQQPSGSQLESLLQEEAARTSGKDVPCGSFSRSDLYRNHA